MQKHGVGGKRGLRADTVGGTVTKQGSLVTQTRDMVMGAHRVFLTQEDYFKIRSSQKCGELSCGTAAACGPMSLPGRWVAFCGAGARPGGLAVWSAAALAGGPCAHQTLLRLPGTGCGTGTHRSSRERRMHRAAGRRMRVAMATGYGNITKMCQMRGIKKKKKKSIMLINISV